MTEGETGDRAAGRETVYDAYVDSALSGEAPEPAAFLAERGLADAELLERLEAVHRVAGRAADDDRLPFERLGQYRVLRRLDAGGMGLVFLGAEDRLGRLVALKVLRPEYQDSPTIAARFEREAQVVARLRHPNIVTIFGVGEESGRRFLAMEYVEGEGLDELIATATETGRPLPVATVVRWAIQIAGALQAAHEAGVVHRDVKPSNIRIAPTGDAVLLDFGIAAEEGASRLTVPGKFLGTAAYSAPEQLGGGDADVDGRADVYSLALVVYEALTGVHPFEGASEAETAARALRGDAESARRVRRDVPLDLATVLEVGLERDRARRYASADAFASDLRAVLAVRPIAARKPNVVRRAWKLARRHPVAASALTVAALAVAGAFVADGVRRRGEAREALAAAQAGVERYAELREDARRNEELYAHLDSLVESRHMTPEDEAELAATERAAHQSRRGREEAFHGVLDDLRRAERLDPSLVGLDAVRGALYTERFREARTQRDDDTAAFYRQAAIRLAPDGEIARERTATEIVRITCATPGAEARVFRYERLRELDPDGEDRMIPVPAGAPGTLPPGAWTFRIVGDHAPLLDGDLVTHVEGEAPTDANWRELRDRVVAGSRCRVLGRGARGEVDVPPGATVRPATQPLEWTETGGRVLAEGAPVPVGVLALVVRAPGYEERRVTVNHGAGAPLVADLPLRPLGSTPRGFVRVETWGNELYDFVIQEREVSCAEYLEFVNDPETRAAIDASERPILYPRSARTVATGGHWTRGDDGRYTIHPEWSPEWPIIGVSYEDAEAYCAWWTRRARSRGEPWTARLPTLDHWIKASEPHASRQFVFGNRFHPKWVSSCFARPRAEPEPVMSYPRDESVYGVFDLSGSVREWTDSWWDEQIGLRRLSGGTWALPQREFFEVWGGIGGDPKGAGDENGFRLVLIPDETGTGNGQDESSR